MIETKRMVKGCNYQLLVVLIGVTTLTAANGWTNSVSQTLIEVFSDIPVAVVRSAVTASSLGSLIVGLIIGRYVGKRFTYRTAIIFGTSCMLIGGVMPAFCNSSFWMIWVCRFITGFGSASSRLSSPLLRYYTGSHNQATWYGWGNVWACMVSILIQNIAAMLAKYQWNFIYLVYGVLIVPLLLIIIKMEEPGNVEVEDITEKHDEFQHEPKILMYFLLLAWIHLAVYPVFTSVSTIITSRGFGDIRVAAAVGSMYVFGVTMMSLVSGKLLILTRRWIFTIGLIVLAGGLGIMVGSQNIAMTGAGAFVAGASYPLLTFTINTFSSDMTSPARRTWIMTLVMAGADTAAFCSSFWISFVDKTSRGFLTFLSSDVERVCLINAVICVLLAGVTLFWDPSVSERQD